MINGWRKAGVQFNQGYNVHGLGGAADGPLGFVNTVMYKSDADAARWFSYVDEWAPMAKKMGALEMKAVQVRPKPSNPATASLLCPIALTTSLVCNLDRW